MDIHIEKLVYGGDGIGQLPDGRKVFIPFVIPGEDVQVNLVDQKLTFARGELINIINPSKYRIIPKCRHFMLCGGCHYQHMPYDKQLEAKQDILRETIDRTVSISNPIINPIVPSPEQWNYRNHIQFHLNLECKLGFLPSSQKIEGITNGLADKVLPIQECFLPILPLNKIWKQIDFMSIEEVNRIGIRSGSDDEILIVIESNHPSPPEFSITLPYSVVYHSPMSQILIAGDNKLNFKIKGRDFRVSAGAFFQVNTSQAENMVNWMISNIHPLNSDLMLELYCGVGLFCAFFASQVNKYVGIEISSISSDDFVYNLNDFSNVSLYEGNVDVILPNLDFKPDIVLLDPPRTGLTKIVINSLINLKPREIIYISCDPATLARDTKHLLTGGFILEQIVPFDLFPQTYHIESISHFRFRN